MLGLLKPALNPVEKFIKSSYVTNDGVIFRLHCVFTAILLVTSSLVLSGKDYVGKPMECIDSDSKEASKPVNTFCWISATFTMADAYQRQLGLEVPQPGIDNDFGEEQGKRYQSYYQWVCIALFFQGLCCSVPKYIWGICENGLLNQLSKDRRLGLYEKDDIKEKQRKIFHYLSSHFKMHNGYLKKYLLCETLCLINITMQLYLMDKFFNGQFFNYGFQVLSFADEDQEQRVDPMIYIFPRVTKCTFLKFGATGTIQNHDYLCLLPLNVVNEKVYVVIWIWFMVLWLLLVSLLFYRAFIFTMPCVRARLLQTKNRMISLDVAEYVTKNSDSGDWWILYMLSHAVEPLIFQEVISKLALKYWAGRHSKMYDFKSATI